jgi:sortase B
MDFKNGALGEDSNHIIYGHNMKNGTMFGMLTQYKDQSYYDQHPIMYYLTPTGNYKLELVVGVVVKSDDRLYELGQDKTMLLSVVNRHKEHSTFLSPVQLSEEDVIVTLSTCSYEFDNARYVLIGKLMPI